MLFYDVHKHFPCLFSNLRPILHFILSNANFREKPKLVKPSESSQGGPEAKKSKVDPNETTMVKKVGEPHRVIDSCKDECD